MLNYGLEGIFTTLGWPKIQQLDQFPKNVKRSWGRLCIASLRPQSPSLYYIERAQDPIIKFLK